RLPLSHKFFPLLVVEQEVLLRQRMELNIFPRSLSAVDLHSVENSASTANFQHLQAVLRTNELVSHEVHNERLLSGLRLRERRPTLDTDIRTVTNVSTRQLPNAKGLVLANDLHHTRVVPELDFKHKG